MRFLTCLAALLFSSAAIASGPRLYVFDCGYLQFADISAFNVQNDESPVREMFVPCYLIEHEKGRLLWDAGLPKGFADASEPVDFGGGTGTYDRWIVDQLADLELTPVDLDYVAFSHLHFDHAGAADALARAQHILMQQTEWQGAFDGSNPAIDASVFQGLKSANLQMLDGDHDVFGDGSVRIIYAPGHTAGHQVLLVNLANTGPVLLSGDLYHLRASRRLRRAPVFNVDASQTFASMDRVEAVLQETGATLWIEHDMALARTLRKAPAYYE